MKIDLNSIYLDIRISIQLRYLNQLNSNLKSMNKMMSNDEVKSMENGIKEFFKKNPHQYEDKLMKDVETIAKSFASTNSYKAVKCRFC